jgi:hypothetical protein
MTSPGETVSLGIKVIQCGHWCDACIVPYPSVGHFIEPVAHIESTRNLKLSEQFALVTGVLLPIV